MKERMHWYVFHQLEEWGMVRKCKLEYFYTNGGANYKPNYLLINIDLEVLLPTLLDLQWVYILARSLYIFKYLK